MTFVGIYLEVVAPARTFQQVIQLRFLSQVFPKKVALVIFFR